MKENLSYKFIKRIYHLNNLEFSPAVIHQAKRCLLDYLGVCYAGSKILETKSRKYFDLIGQTGSSNLIGINQKSSIHDAILWHGMNSHVPELDDGIRYGVLHPGSPIISALMPIAEKENIENVELLRGIIVGYETSIRLASAIQPSHYSMGFHPTSTCGTIGAAIGIAAMLKYTENEMFQTLSAACLSAYGTLKVIEDGSELKPYNSGRAALNGFISAYIGKSFFAGDKDPLGGTTGFLSMMSSGFDEKELFGNKAKLAIENIYFKPYASCRHTHPAIEAALAIKISNGLLINDIKKITIRTYKSVLGKHDYKEIINLASAKMSIPYSVALALKTGKAGLSDYNETNLEDIEIITLCKNTIVEEDEKITSLVPHSRAANVIIEMKSGEVFNHRIDYPKGEPENPMSDDELLDKFLYLITYWGMDNSNAQSIISSIMKLENEENSIFEIIKTAEKKI